MISFIFLLSRRLVVGRTNIQFMFSGPQNGICDEFYKSFNGLEEILDKVVES